MFIKGQCQCDFQGRFITTSILNCVEQTPTQAVYLANISSYTTFTTDQLIGYINDWGAGDPVIQAQANERTVVDNCVCPIVPSGTFDVICSLLQEVEPTEVLDYFILISTHSSVNVIKL